MEILLSAAACLPDPALETTGAKDAAAAGGNAPAEDAPPTQLPSPTLATPTCQPVDAQTQAKAQVLTTGSPPASTSAASPGDSQSASTQTDLPTNNPTASKPEPTFDWHDLIEHDLWSQVPSDVPELLEVLRESDLYDQDEVEVRLHPTLTRVWSRKGRRNQRLVRAPGQNRRFVGFAATDWRDGWISIGYGLGRTAEVLCLQLDHLVERSQGRGRKAMVLLDNLRIHTPKGSKLLQETLAKHGDKLRLVYTPAYDPEANPIERLFRPFRLAVTHNHHHDEVVGLYNDTVAYFDRLDNNPNLVLTHIGSPFASTQSSNRSTPVTTLSLPGRS